MFDAFDMTEIEKHHIALDFNSARLHTTIPFPWAEKIFSHLDYSMLLQICS